MFIFVLLYLENNFRKFFSRLILELVHNPITTYFIVTRKLVTQTTIYQHLATVFRLDILFLKKFKICK